MVESAPGARYTLRECGVVRTRPQAPIPERLRDIFDGVAELIGRHRPDALAIEDIFFARNVRTTVVLGEARGVILLAAQQHGLEIHEYPPAEIKKAIVGNGAATKTQVQFMVARLLKLKQAPQPADAADGVAAALACAMGARITRLAASLLELPPAAPPRTARRT